MNIYIYIGIYLLGYFFAVIQHRKNHLLFAENERTNEDLIISLLWSLMSWVWFLILFGMYLYDAKLPKFKYWLKQSSKY